MTNLLEMDTFCETVLQTSDRKWILSVKKDGLNCDTAIDEFSKGWILKCCWIYTLKSEVAYLKHE